MVGCPHPGHLPVPCTLGSLRVPQRGDGTGNRHFRYGTDLCRHARPRPSSDPSFHGHGLLRHDHLPSPRSSSSQFTSVERVVEYQRARSLLLSCQSFLSPWPSKFWCRPSTGTYKRVKQLPRFRAQLVVQPGRIRLRDYIEPIVLSSLQPREDWRYPPTPGGTSPLSRSPPRSSSSRYRIS